MRIPFDKNAPVGVRRFLPKHEVHTILDMGWPDQLENGELLKVAEESGLDVMVTSDQNIRYQQNLTGRELALVVPGSNIWPVVLPHAETIGANVDAATPAIAAPGQGGAPDAGSPDIKDAMLQYFGGVIRSPNDTTNYSSAIF